MLTKHEYDVLYIACEMERRGIMTYRRAQTLVDDKKVRSLLQCFESDETEHLKRFSEMLENVPNEDTGEKHILMSAYAQKALLNGGVMEMVREEAFNSWKSLIAYAINDEANAVKTYEEFSNEANDSLVKAMFLMVRDEEKTHLDHLTALKEKMLAAD